MIAPILVVIGYLLLLMVVADWVGENSPIGRVANALAGFLGFFVILVVLNAIVKWAVRLVF